MRTVYRIPHKAMWSEKTTAGKGVKALCKFVMNRIRIKSNPYKKEIEYARYDEKTGDYIVIASDNYPKSKLIGDLEKCFFPFKAKEIISIIIDEFKDPNNPEIFFEGPNDEYTELIDVKETDSDFKNICIYKGEEYLADGRDVIVKINERIKNDIEQIVKDCVRDDDNAKQSLQQKLNKYTEASNVYIPICVIGNTNMGKSTFINALVGAEYLPQDKNRCTAKVYKITQSEQFDRAKVSFSYNGQSITIIFKDTFEISGKLSHEIEKEIQRILNEKTDCCLSERVSTLLKFLNTYDEKNESNQKQVVFEDDIIELEVPFNSDILQKSNNQFIIFDTPGSNYAGNKKDADLLKKHMNGLTNGLPIFVTTYSGLSTNDNDELIKELQSIEELDQRFTILVINKADERELKLKESTWNRQEEDKIKDQELPRRIADNGLQGIYFVSSWFGLGYKNNGHFLDSDESDTYERDVRDFDGSSNPKYTKRLYKFNILPEQIKKKFEQGIPENINAVYLNSGLYSIEKEIDTYATKYSAYNKCLQSCQYLDDVFAYISKQIEVQTTSITNDINDYISTFNKEKQELCKKIKDKIVDQQEQYNKIRENQIKETLCNEVVYFEKGIFEKIYEDKYK